MGLTFERGVTSKRRLNIAWDTSGVTRWVQIKDQLAALEHMADDDPRPLLIHRVTHDSGKATKKVRQLEKEALASERFKLTSHWFHCVELGKEVMQKDHPYHVLFQGKKPARLILASPDGKKVVRFLGSKSQRVNWKDIARVLKASYKNDPTKAIRGLERLLNQFDVLDARIKDLGEQIAMASAKNNASSLPRLKAKMRKIEEQKKKALAEEKEQRDLVLRKPPKKKATDDDR